MKQKTGFTMIEVITTSAIVVLLLAILTPAFVQAKNRSKITAALNNLHQLGVATRLYQSDWGSDLAYGNIGQMGLPPPEVALRTRLKLPFSVFTSPCGLNPSWAPRGAVIQVQYWPDEGDTFAAAARKFGENTVLWTDLNCDEPGVDVRNPFRSHRGLGVYLDGHAASHVKEGNVDQISWWSSAQAGLQD